MTTPTPEEDPLSEPWEHYYSTPPPNPNQTGPTPEQIKRLDAFYDETYYYGEY